MGRLTVISVKAAKAPGRYQDGDGLMLNIGKTGKKSWILRHQHQGKRRDFGLGSATDIGLAEARERAADLRKQLRQGVDPTEEKKVARAVAAIPTFRAAAEAVHEQHKLGWKNGKHQAQWLATLEAYAFPTLGKLRVDKIDNGHILDVLLPIWLAKPETARRVRQRIGLVLDYCHAKHWRAAEAPMRSVSRALPKQPKRDGHFAAMPYADVPTYLSKLRERVSFGRLALEAAILTACRSGEVRGARWTEFDLDAGKWTIPAERMKGGEAHMVTLSPAAVDCFQRARLLRLSNTDLVFPGLQPDREMSDMTLLKILRDQALNYTVHGFRSAFRDWAAEKTNFPREIAEAALAHINPNETERAYLRTDHGGKRRKLLDAWGAFCTRKPAEILKLAANRGR